MIIDKKQLRDDIEKRKELPKFGISSDKNIQRLRIITETRRSFTPEVVEALLDELESLRSRTQSVPSEMTPIIEDDEIIAYERHGERFSTIIGATWNTCRAVMLQAGNSPVAPDTWIPVSERMPEPGRWLALYGAPVFTRGENIGKPCCDFDVAEGYLDQKDGKFYLLNWESPGLIGDSYNNHLAIATYWMYWELPEAPHQEVK